MIDFLKRYQEELISDKIVLKEKIDLLDSKINEENKFIEILDSDKDDFFSDFSPREFNAKNKAKADEIRIEVQKLTNELDSYLKQMNFIDNRLNEIRSILSEINKDNINQIKNNNNSLVEKLKTIKSIIILDPQRASIELDSLINSLSK